MNPRAYELAVKKQHLLMVSEQLRHDLGVYSQGLSPAFGLADGVAATGRWLKAHPGVMLGFVVGFVAMQPTRAWRWAQRAFSAWRNWRRFLVWFGL